MDGFMTDINTKVIGERANFDQQYNLQKRQKKYK